MSRADILHLSHRHPLQLIHLLWQWEWHALVIWAVLAALLMPVIAVQIRKALVLSMRWHKDLLLESILSPGGQCSMGAGLRSRLGSRQAMLKRPRIRTPSTVRLTAT